jgi:uncharacterized protein (TIGR00730 family)
MPVTDHFRYRRRMQDLRSVCVFCGSSSGTDAVYGQTAVDLGSRLAAEGIRLVYGGTSVGLMGLVADAALAGGGEVTGVIPRGPFLPEIAHPALTSLVEVGSMHERKQMMFESSDAFVALPGGLGTLEELTEVATWAQLGMHQKPVATLDVAGYWRLFHELLGQAVATGFMKEANLRLIADVRRVEDLLPALRSYDVPPTGKWLDRPAPRSPGA